MAKSTVFTWEGVDGRGHQVSGELTAPTPHFAHAQLRRQGIAARRVRKKRAAGLGLGGRVKTADISLFSRQMATMMRSGVPLVQAFDVVASGARNAKLAAVIQGVRGDVAAGASLASALARFPGQFNHMYRNLVSVGEKSGTLDTMLDRIAAYQEGAERARRKVRKAMTYPLLVVAAASIVTTILLIYVVPQFEAVFAMSGARLPAFTRFVISVSEVVRAWWLALLLGICGAGVGLVVLRRRSPAFRDALDRAFLKTPVLGGILNQSAAAHYASTLATAMAAGVPLVEALGSAASAASNAFYASAIRRIRDDVAAGRSLHAAMRDGGVFPAMMVQMVVVGEESGSLDAMLGKAADHFESLVSDTIDNLTTLLEPLLMAVLGILVGGLVVAMYLPVFQLGTVFG